MGDHGGTPQFTASGAPLNDRWVFVGSTGSGKSTLALRYGAGVDYPNLIAWDMKGESLRGAANFWPWVPWAPIYTRVSDLGNYGGGKAILRLADDQREPEHYAAVMEWALKWAFRNGALVLEIDEAYTIVRRGGKAVTAFEKTLTEGRSYGLGLQICTQRPSRLPLFALSEAQHYCVFRLKLKKDRIRMAECMEIESELPNPPGKHGFYYHQDGWDAPLLVPEGINIEKGVTQREHRRKQG